VSGLYSRIYGIFYVGIKIFHTLPFNLVTMKNEKAHFKLALRIYCNTHCFYSLEAFLTTRNESNFHLQIMNCVYNLNTLCKVLIILCTVYCVFLRYLYNLFNILLLHELGSGSTEGMNE
jgi:hypothetical protein